MINEHEAYQQGLEDARTRRFPLYMVLWMAEQFRLAGAYRKGYMVYRDDPAKIRVSGRYV